MFNIGSGELVLIALVALFIMPTEKLPQMAVTLGRFFAQLQRGMDDIKKGFKDSLQAPRALPPPPPSHEGKDKQPDKPAS